VVPGAPSTDEPLYNAQEPCHFSGASERYIEICKAPFFYSNGGLKKFHAKQLLYVKKLTLAAIGTFLVYQQRDFPTDSEVPHTTLPLALLSVQSNLSGTASLIVHSFLALENVSDGAAIWTSRICAIGAKEHINEHFHIEARYDAGDTPLQLITSMISSGYLREPAADLKDA
jgi:hypothetical protein